MLMKTKIERATEESDDFGKYAEYMLSEYPEMNMQTLRDCYKHNASAAEYRAHMERLQQRAQPPR